MLRPEEAEQIRALVRDLVWANGDFRAFPTKPNLEEKRAKQDAFERRLSELTEKQDG